LTGFGIDDRNYFMKYLKILLIFVSLMMITPCAFAAGGLVSFNMNVPPGQWKAARLKNLPKDAVVAVQAESDGQVLIALLDSTSGGKPDTSRPLFTGTVEKRLSFSVTVANAGHHYLVFDNRRGSATRAVKATIHAARKTADRSDQLDAANQMMRVLELQLSRLFIFDPFPIALRSCGSPRAFADPSGIVLCKEYIQHLYRILENRERTLDVLSFSLFHEIGRVLLSHWDNPFSTNAEAVDELATVLMVMLNQKARARGAAAYMIKNPAASHALKKLFPDENHPLSSRRAKHVLIWVRDPKLPLKWQHVLVPHMQTQLLKKLKAQPTPWTDLSLVEEELAERGKKAI
jgi:hypothetical protein